MALKLKLDPTFWWPIEITVPGQEKPARIEVEFVYKTRTEYEAFQKKIREAEKPLTDEELCAEIMRNWRGVEEDFSTANVSRLLDAYPAAGKEIAQQYFTAVLESRRGNSRR